MLSMQTMESAPTHSAGPLAAENGGEIRPQKPKTLPCKYCSKRFRRVEHVQRHERTHTKEKPFSCNWDHCGKTFGRRDLLVRHEKLVHLNEGSKENSRPRKLSTGAAIHKPSLSDSSVIEDTIGIRRTTQSQPQPHAQQISPTQYQHPLNHGPPVSLAQDPRVSSRAAACNLDLLSDAALASEVNPMPPMMAELPPPPPNHATTKPYAEATGGYQDRPREESHVLSSGYAPQPQQSAFEDYNIFLDEFGASPHFLPPHLDPDINPWSRSPGTLHQRGPSKPSSVMPSRFGSLAPDPRESSDSGSRMQDDLSRASSHRISVNDHAVIKSRLDEFSAVLPPDFVFPSRHTLMRFLEGYISGFHEHLPFLHLPTLSPAEIAPELLLAILAVGAQYRFENNRGYALWYAAKAVAMEQIRRRHMSEVHALLPTAAAYSPHSTRPSPSATYRHSFASAQSERPITQDTHREPYTLNTPQARLETIQTVLLLFAVGLWGAKTILHDALSLQGNLAILIREEGLSVDTSPGSLTDWDAWIRHESAIRTKLIAFCFFNLCSTAYDMPPLLLTSELNLYLPLRSRLWRAESAWQWQDLRQATPVTEITVHEAFSRLFGRSSQPLPTHLSSLGNYVLIHALIQHIYLLKQTSIAAGAPYDVHRTLKPEDVEDVTQALRVWQTSFEHRHQLRSAESGQFSGADPVNGALAYNATALLRLAYIRLYTDIPPSRALETRDTMMIASALGATPMLSRSLRLHRAVFQAIHALSMLVKAGVNYVARTKSAEWSIQHSLCNFECAILLAKWLLTLASITPSDPPASPEEKSLLEMVRRMLDETEFAVPVDPSLSGPGPGASHMEMATSDSARLRQLAGAVVKLWAETFKGTHIFDMVKVMGLSLDGYAELVQKPRDRMSMGRLTTETAMA
ncbi:hypothetical protein B0I35DRAFT_450864 [Stachybotrys elegans]|uniref:C2H2-type domain-containing protein n=1 Tax=Stachybotrys elegans TaxID=80388 RepID=A0A8K0SQ65_9HYPO|nr:hypothetical protein B0I35DRAFT_450864 [Stachybotrys elegans]